MKSRGVRTKRFDCVEMMHEGAARVREETAGMTIEEQATYWEARTKALLARQATLRAKKNLAGGQRKSV